MKCKECIETSVVDGETFYKEHDMVRKGTTTRTSEYIDEEGRSWIREESIWQCPNCKDIVIE